MTSRGQIALAAVLVLGAGAVTLAATDGGTPAGRSGGGHDHAAMAGGAEERPVRLSEEMRRRIGVTYAEAVEEAVRREVRAVGTVTYDERRLVSLNPKIEGWVEELFVDYTGAEVERGEPMLRVYSPAMVAAQEELLLASRLVDRTRQAPGTRAAANAADLLEAARRRLAYWDVPDDEIRRVEETGRPRKALLLRAPASGVVVEKHAQVGARVIPGSPLYHIADLSAVWVEAEVFEKDLSLVERGQAARVSLEAYPGESFSGRVTYVYPTVSMESRTARVRVEIPNPDGQLKPGMYATVRLRSPAAAPSVTVPRTAVLNTGERSVVFVRASDDALVPREVRTGLTTGDRIVVVEGLEAGETVVASAAFLIDAESSLGAAMKAMGSEVPVAGSEDGVDAGRGGG
jgi:Cu(I)/Ag(I) efflux system membrane fusion protein